MTAVLLLLASLPSRMSIPLAQAGGSVQNGKQLPRQALPSPKFFEVALEPNVTGLPPLFLGHDPARLFRALQRLRPPKGEFESTDEYRARLVKLSASKLFGELTATSNLAAVIVPTVHYDADAKIMTAEVFAPSFVNEALFIELAKDEKVTGSYIGSNAYGVNRRVTRIRRERWGLGLSDPYSFRDKDSTSLKIGFALERAVAKELKTRFAIAVFYTLRSPFATTVSQQSTATIDFPYEDTDVYRLLLAEVSAIAVFDMRTGKIYGRRVVKKEDSESASSTSRLTYTSSR